MYRARENNNHNIQKMYDIMTTHYDKLKDSLGLKDVFDTT